MREKIIFGVTGTNGAGKGTIVEFLVEEKGFKHFSASGLITEEIKRRGMLVDRNSMRDVGNDLRKIHGPGYVAEELFRRARASGENAIIESIRTLGEVDLVKKEGGVLLAVDAEVKTRYERIRLRKTAKDMVSFEEFVRQENMEMGSSDPNKQNLRACINAADKVILNNGTKEELNQKVEEILKIYIK
ncbi:AAA family ATPase [Patescibacteria group bacterium]|nr:AAA family ATPase [Patescibacteria group bacterium]